MAGTARERRENDARTWVLTQAGTALHRENWCPHARVSIGPALQTRYFTVETADEQSYGGGIRATRKGAADDSVLLFVDISTRYSPCKAKKHKMGSLTLM